MHEMAPTKFDIGEIQMMQRENKTQATIFLIFFFFFLLLLCLQELR